MPELRVNITAGHYETRIVYSNGTARTSRVWVHDFSFNAHDSAVTATGLGKCRRVDSKGSVGESVGHLYCVGDSDAVFRSGSKRTALTETDKGEAVETSIGWRKGRANEKNRERRIANGYPGFLDSTEPQSAQSLHNTRYLDVWDQHSSVLFTLPDMPDSPLHTDQSYEMYLEEDKERSEEVLVTIDRFLHDSSLFKELVVTRELYGCDQSQIEQCESRIVGFWVEATAR